MEIIPDITTMQCREVSCGEATLEWCGPLWSFEISSWRIGSCLIIFTRTADLLILEPFVGHILKSDPGDNTIPTHWRKCPFSKITLLTDVMTTSPVVFQLACYVRQWITLHHSAVQ